MILFFFDSIFKLLLKIKLLISLLDEFSYILGSYIIDLIMTIKSDIVDLSKSFIKKIFPIKRPNKIVIPI